MNISNRSYGALLFSPISLVYVTFLLVPISFFLILGLFEYDAFVLYKPTVTGANFSRLLFDPFYRDIIGLTLKIAALVTLLSFLIGYPLAYFLARTKSAWRGLLMFLVVAPLMTGVLVRTYGWIIVLGSEGIINQALLASRMIAEPLQILNSETAVAIALVHILLPYMVFPLISALASQEPDIENAAATLGASKLRSFFEVTFPLSRSGILMGSVLVFTLAAGSVVTPALLGGKNVQMLGQVVYELVLHTLNWPLAAAVASILVVLQLFVISVYFIGGQGAGAHGK